MKDQRAGIPGCSEEVPFVLATRTIMEDLRAGMDGMGGGPPLFSKADRSRVLQALDRVLVGMVRVD
ncbi:DUF188 domain-containing protein [Qipengyuania pacifica]|uniref:DUF188 domain-containing protein n=1 Tax=Qipengyuania pacifica TaxID=2860199 RepID=UPI0024941205|nr:DUF188 domain-containing protein [Qipengyuania aerophila]